MSGVSSQLGLGVCEPTVRARLFFRLQGFTLVELLVTLSVASILLAIAMPSFRSFMQDTRLSMEANTLVYDLNLARSESVKLDTTVEVCASADSTTCSTVTPNWATGWIVTCPAACPASLGAPPVVLRVSPGLNANNTVRDVLGGVSAVSFVSTGQTNGGKVQFVFCDQRGAANGRDVEVSSIGEIASSPTPGQTVGRTAIGGC